jgi:hypothetical protein
MLWKRIFVSTTSLRRIYADIMIFHSTHEESTQSPAPAQSALHLEEGSARTKKESEEGNGKNNQRFFIRFFDTISL